MQVGSLLLPVGTNVLCYRRWSDVFGRRQECIGQLTSQFVTTEPTTYCAVAVLSSMRSSHAKRHRLCGKPHKGHAGRKVRLHKMQRLSFAWKELWYCAVEWRIVSQPLWIGDAAKRHSPRVPSLGWVEWRTKRTSSQMSASECRMCVWWKCVYKKMSPPVKEMIRSTAGVLGRDRLFKRRTKIWYYRHWWFCVSNYGGM